MAFRELYDFAQLQSLPISRNTIKAEAIRISGVDDVKFVRSGLDPATCRGYWLTPTNADHHLVKQYGCHIAVVARDLNRCWDRFVTIKEMMHLFDSEDQKTSNAELFEDLIAEFSSPMSPSPQMRSEFSAFWRALAVLCPEETRQEFRSKWERAEIDPYEIALQLRIPEQYVPRLFERRYDIWLTENL